MSGSTFQVRSADGTSIAVWVDGSGPPLVLVHGAVSDHTTFAPLVGELRNHVTTFATDRRGRGASGDGAGEYSIEREFEDIAAVVEAVAARAGQSVALSGHSYRALRQELSDSEIVDLMEVMAASLQRRASSDIR